MVVTSLSERHACEAPFLFPMIKLTTGVAFLVSSLYGSGQPAIAQSTPNPVAVVQSTTTEDWSDSKNVEAYVRTVYADTPILVDIARCESTFRQYDTDGTVIRGKVNPGDVGVMQINEKYHAPEAAKLGMDLYTVEGNTAYAKHLYDKFGTTPWDSSKPCWGEGLAINK